MAESTDSLDHNLELLMGMVAHEIRTPLQAVLASVQLIEQADQKTRTFAKNTGIIKRQVQMLDAMLECLYLYIGIQKEKVTFKKKNIAMSDLVQGSLEACAPLIKLKMIRVEIIERHPSLVDCASVLITQSLTNILVNAIKFSAPGGTITIITDFKEGWHTFAVQDEGVGLSSCDQDRLFQLFHQENPVIDHGLGLGLYLADRFIKIHEGTITARSNSPGKGSTFTIAIP
jgi:signal transduction histidine kinase